MKNSSSIVTVPNNSRQITLDAANLSYINLSARERIISFAGGVLLTAFGRELGRKGTAKMIYNLLTLPLGIYLMKRGITGYCVVNTLIDRNKADPAELEPVEIRTSFRVAKPRKEVYRQWRTLGNLPELLPHIRSVVELDEKRSHWTASLPGGIGKLEWYAEIVDDVKNERIGWQSVAGSDIGNAGEVRFLDAENGETEVDVWLQYIPPAGNLGKTVARLFNPALRKLLNKDFEVFGNREKGAA